MATIRRYPVPAESYEPNRPLNDLGRDQLLHFIHVAKQLPAGFRWEGVPPSPEDGPACTRYITTVTEHLMSMRKAGLTLVSSRPRKAPKAREARVDIAANASSSKTPIPPATKKSKFKVSAKESPVKKASKPRGRKP